MYIIGLPWWFSAKESTCQGRRHRFGMTPQVTEQLSLDATAIEPVL